MNRMAWPVMNTRRPSSETVSSPPRREICFAAIVTGAHDQLAAERLKVHLSNTRIHEVVQHEGCRKRRVTAKRDLAARREPFQLIATRTCRHDKGRFGVIVFDGDGLHPSSVRHLPAGEDRCRIAPEQRFCERVDDILSHKLQVILICGMPSRMNGSEDCRNPTCS